MKIKLMLLPLLLISPLVAQQKTPTPKQGATIGLKAPTSPVTKAPEVKNDAKQEAPKIIQYTPNDIQKLQLDNVQKDWQIAIQRYYMICEAIKNQNEWPKETRCNIDSGQIVGPEKKEEKKEEPKK